ncbi:hypothetical protein P4B35_20475 [Pontiellaceae bacterium B12227]|nr:hypothetical protein [Pontiellaceae bacterium B12227]
MKALRIGILLIGLVGLAAAQTGDTTEPEDKLISPWYVNFYYGNSPVHANGTFSATQAGGNPRVPQDENLSGGTVKTMGMTTSIGRQYPAYSLGTAVDVGYLSYESDSGHVDLDALRFSGLLHVETALLKSSNVPSGRISPYAEIGGTVLFGDLDAKIFYDDAFVAYGDDDVIGAGIDMRVGLKFMVTGDIGLFTEYRYQWFFVSSTYEGDAWGATTLDYESLEMHLSFGQAVVGVVFAY